MFKSGLYTLAALAGIESISRGIVSTAVPLVLYRVFANSQTVTEVYFVAGIVSFAISLCTPTLSRFIRRRILYSAAIISVFVGGLCALIGSPVSLAAAVIASTTGTALIAITFNSYVLDNIGRSELAKFESIKIACSGFGLTVGPLLGVYLMTQWQAAPFVVLMVAMLLLLVVLFVSDLGNGKNIKTVQTPPLNPIHSIMRFIKQPRLLSGWYFAVLKSCTWWVFTIFVPIYAVENGLHETTAGVIVSATNSLIFLSPLIFWWMKGRVRDAVRLAFFGSSVCFLMASLIPGHVEITIALLMFGMLFATLLDVYGNLPFLLSVKPSERVGMSAVFSTHRDTAGVIMPASSKLILLFAPLQGVFTMTALGLFSAALIAGLLHPRLGARKR